MSQMVQVVSMDEVPMMLGSVSFQSKEVSGAQNSVFLFCADRREGQDARAARKAGQQVVRSGGQVGRGQGGNVGGGEGGPGGQGDRRVFVLVG